MPRRLFFKCAGVLFFVACGFGFPTQAWAGFQWVAPTAPLPSANQPAALPVPAPNSSVTVSPLTSADLDSSPEVITPIIIDGSQPKLPVTTPSQGGGYAGSAPPFRPTQTLSAAGPGEIVHGFAKAVPLAVALRQILPPGYAFSIDQGVDMGTLVSFQGGRPWRDTLRETLKPAGLIMREKGQMVSIGFAADEEPSLPMTQISPISLPTPSARPMASPMYADTRSVVVEPQPAGPPVTGNATWTATHGDTLHKVLEEWCRRANVEFDWLAEYDYPLEASATFNGTFEDAVRGLLVGFESAHPQPVAELHSNPRVGQMVLVIQTRGNTNTD